MKKYAYTRSLWCAVLLCALVFTIVIPANANQIEDQYSSVIKNIELEKIESEPPKQVIDVFDVREDGWFAVGLNSQEICVYDQNGVYQYGFRFNINGAFAVELLANNIVIYFIRGDKAVYLDKDGNCVSYFDTTSEYNIQLLERTSKQINGDSYQLERDVGIFGGDYARLVKVAQAGDRTVLYDASSIGLAVGIWHYVVLLGGFACFVFGGAHILKKKLSEPE